MNKINSLDAYIDRSGKAMLAGCWTYDNARAAEKMLDWDNIGKNNEAWKEGPFLSAGSGQKEIDRTRPYCFRMSEHFSTVASMVVGPPQNGVGKIQIPLPPLSEQRSKVEPVISKLIIIEQFELFKEFLETFEGPTNKKRRTEWESILDEEVIKDITKITDRRNALTHDSIYELSSMQEAVEYFEKLKYLAPILFNLSS
ncbi:hypothetical protein J3492_08970 [Psychrobacter sp. F1192]|uniref:RiboL-PSP-HEPN domain-containing protein n=1 Tax=Psychrobacter coccoides TaxID=2818440 RepID=A0ABS3NQM9_9GAMM|nr:MULTISPECIES: hypothetical protein [Psychrobacter]AMN68448.1 hypothetical protein AK825_12745 [Psychrobacter sp. P11G5]MBO1531344.1 hypothetical protein [Psychrobacter coccoides]